MKEDLIYLRNGSQVARAQSGASSPPEDTLGQASPESDASTDRLL